MVDISKTSAREAGFPTLAFEMEYTFKSLILSPDNPQTVMHTLLNETWQVEELLLRK